MLLAFVSLVLAPTAPATAQGGERIREYHVDVMIAESGEMQIVETIRYDFGPNERRGIFRDIPVRLRYDDRYDRLYRMDVERVDTSEGAPNQYVVEDIGGGEQRIRIGNPDVFITGVHTYEIHYRIRGAMNGFESHDELYWNAIGADWGTFIDAATVTVTAPGAITEVACFAGSEGSSLSCEGMGFSGNTATFEQPDMWPYHGLTIVVGLPKGAVAEPTPILDERWSLTRAFSVNPLTMGGAIAVLAIVVATLGYLVWTAGRDRRWAGSAVDTAFGSFEGETQRVGLFEDRIYPLEYTPPDGLRPGEIGVLVDEIAHPLDVTATIIDLAVRGHLRIEEIEEDRGIFNWFPKSDWRLIKLESNDPLERYEQLLLDGLFKSGDEVELSSLKTAFVERLKRVQDEMYEAVVDHGWFIRNPKQTRSMWLGIGVAVLVAAIGIQAAAIVWTHYALIPLALPVGGLALVAMHGAMPHRTARGTAALVRVRGFRRFIETAETERARFAENANLFYEYLPYAIVFGATERWAQAFQGLASEPSNPGWYSSSRPFAVGAFAGSMNSFAVTSSGTIASTPGGSGSSGFSGGSVGGGGGGGGGGSW